MKSLHQDRLLVYIPAAGPDRASPEKRPSDVGIYTNVACLDSSSTTMPSRLQTTRTQIIASLDALGPGVYTFTQLGDLLSQSRKRWKLAGSTSTNRLIEFLEEETELLRVIKLSAPEPHQRSLTRYIWRSASDFELALTIRGGAYFSHGTALYLNGLSDVTPSTLHVNKEQSPKSFDSSLTQEGINRAFSHPQRSSNYVFRLQELEAIVLSGKHTGDAGVESVAGPEGKSFRTTGIDRTLIDIVVRPAYAGGLDNVVKAYRSAKGRASGKRILELLEAIDHVYPYQQAIGFLMQYAGYPKAAYQPLRSRMSDFDFYLDHQMAEKKFVPDWKLYVPASMSPG